MPYRIELRKPKNAFKGLKIQDSHLTLMTKKLRKKKLRIKRKSDMDSQSMMFKPSSRKLELKTNLRSLKNLKLMTMYSGLLMPASSRKNLRSRCSVYARSFSSKDKRSWTTTRRHVRRLTRRRTN
jgi:hypothetical protein